LLRGVAGLGLQVVLASSAPEDELEALLKALDCDDAVWDAHSAAGAALPCIGVLSGGVSRAELREAGASPVFADAQDLLDQLDSTRIAELAPGR